MKILYIGSERSDAETAATALRGIARNVTVSWAPRLDHAARWLDENRDLAALVVESQNTGGSPSVLKHVRGHALRPAVVVIVPEGTGPQFEALDPEADDYIAKNDSLFRDLPIVVKRAVARARGDQQSQQTLKGVGKTHERFEVPSERPHDNRSRWEETLEHVGVSHETLEGRQQTSVSASRQSAATREVPDMMPVPARIAAQPDARLRVVKAAHDAPLQIPAESQTARDRAERAGASKAATPAADRLAQYPPNIDARLADATAAKSALERRLADVETSHHQREQLWSVEKAAAVERQAQLDGLIDLERAARADLEQKLAHATAALLDTEQRHLAAMTAANEQLAERQTHFDRELSQTGADRDRLSQRLSEAEGALDRVRRDHQSATADVERLTQREADLTSQLADLEAARHTIDRQLAEAASATKHVAEREAELDGQIQQERAARADLEQKLAHATAALLDAEQRHLAAMAAADEQLAERQAQYEIGMARTAATWDMVDEQLRAAALEVERARQDQTSAAAHVDRLTLHVSDLSSQLAEATANNSTLERRLADAEAAVEAAKACTEHERLAAAEQLAERQGEFQAQIAQEIDRRRSVEDMLAQAVTALDDAEKRHESAITNVSAQSRELEEAHRLTRQDLESKAADVERLTKRETDLTSMLADAAASRNNLERRLAATEAAFHDAETRATRERLAASKRAAEREAELDGQIRQERATRAAFEQAAADADAALRDGQQRHDAALAAAATELAERQAHFDRELSQTGADRDRLTQRLSEAEGALDQVRRDHQSAAADVERLTQREADLTSQLAELEAARHTFEHQLAEAASAIADAAERQAELDGQIRHERATRAGLEQAVVDAETALRDGQQRHDAALAAAATELAERQAHFDRELSQTGADRDRLTHQLSETEGALDQVRRDHESAAADVERLTQREAGLTSQLAELEAIRHTLEHQLAEAASATADADERAAHERAAAADRQADLEARLAQAIETHDTLERTLAETRSAALEAERLFHEETEALRARGLEQQAHFEVQLAQQRLEHESRLAEMGERTRNLALERDALQQSLATIQEQWRGLDMEHREMRERFEQARTAADADIRRLTAKLGDTERILADARRDFQDTLDGLSSEHATALAARHHDIEHLQEKLTVAIQELEVTKRRQEALQTEADQVPRLHQQLEESRVESHRLFQQAGMAMFRCTRDGALTQANRAGMSLVGRRTIDELRGAQFAAGVFEAPDNLSWLIERCLSTKAKESIETTWRRKDGGRLFVRLSARQSASGVIEIAAEDLTRLRTLQERLGQALRMEAVGWLASEVAVTCGNLLSDVHQNGQEWLRTADGNAAARQRCEMLLDEVTRAAGLLRQLAAYGDEQARTPTLVDLNTVIRDLEPVLKRVAGDDVEVQLPDTSSSLHVDVGTERVERLLVNLASYGRERMPFGGQLRIELGTIVVDRHFAAKHPNVRLGPHALITVTEIRRPAQADGRLLLRDGTTADHSHGSVAPKTGIDFGALQRLVGECGGHLWMTVQPLGDMVAKVRLPLLTSHEQTHPGTLAARGGRSRMISRWFSTDR